MVMYLDNIFIFIQTLEEYHRVIHKAMEVLAEHKLFLCLEKYKFNKQQIKYLNLVISKK